MKLTCAPGFPPDFNDTHIFISMYTDSFRQYGSFRLICVLGRQRRCWHSRTVQASVYIFMYTRVCANTTSCSNFLLTNVIVVVYSASPSKSRAGICIATSTMHIRHGRDKNGSIVGS